MELTNFFVYQYNFYVIVKVLGTQELLTIPTSWQETHLQVFPPVMPLQFWIETLGSAHPSKGHRIKRGEAYAKT